MAMRRISLKNRDWNVKTGFKRLNSSSADADTYIEGEKKKYLFYSTFMTTRIGMVSLSFLGSAGWREKKHIIILKIGFLE